MKRIFAIVAAACVLITAFIPVFTLTKGAGHDIGRMPLLVIYPGLVGMIRIGDFRYVPLVSLWIGMHLFLSLAPAWIVVRILKRRKQNRAEQGVAPYVAQGAPSGER